MCGCLVTRYIQLPYLDSVIVPGQLTSETDQSCNQVKALWRKKKKRLSAFIIEKHIKIHLLIECDQNVRLVKKVTIFPIKHESIVKETLIIWFLSPLLYCPAFSRNFEFRWIVAEWKMRGVDKQARDWAPNSKLGFCQSSCPMYPSPELLFLETVTWMYSCRQCEICKCSRWTAGQDIFRIQGCYARKSRSFKKNK